MSRKKICCFTIADDRNQIFLERMEKSLRKFHSKQDLPLEMITGPILSKALSRDPNFFYRATPVLAEQLLKEYETVIKLDCDQIIVSDLNHIINDKEEYDVGTVFNDLPLRVWDIQTYYNCGLVVMKNQEFVNHWHKLCYSSHFDSYQYREQDLLSVLTSDYFNYKTKCYDLGERLNGLVAKPAWASCFMKEGKIMLETPHGKKQLSVIHFAGGENDPSKGNYRIRFQPTVVKYIDSLLK